MEVCNGRLFDIHHLSTHDGPGLRSTIFLKGCSLACQWCHNPESISYEKEEQTIPGKGTKIIGEDRTVDDVYQEILRYKLFYINSGGGITFSGGEALTQVEFVYNLAKKIKTHEPDIHIAMDTCLAVSKSAVEKLLPYIDLWLVDLKIMDSNEHKNATGHGNEKILSNCEYLISELDHNKKECWIRTPLIPEYTMTEKNIREISTFINNINKKAQSHPLTKWELCTFNNLCEDKYNKLNQLWTCRHLSMLTQKEKDKYKQLATGLCPDIVVDATGLVIS